MLRYFPNTNSIILTGDENNNVNVLVRCSSLKNRILRNGSIIIIIKPAVCMVPATTVLLIPSTLFGSFSCKY